MKIANDIDTMEFTHTFYGIDDTRITAEVISSMLNLLSSKLQIEDLKMGVNPSDDNVILSAQKLAAMFAEIAVESKRNK